MNLKLLDLIIYIKYELKNYLKIIKILNIKKIQAKRYYDKRLLVVLTKIIIILKIIII